MSNTPAHKNDSEVKTGTVIVAPDYATVTLPPELDGMINLRSWAEALIKRTKYHEPNPNYLSTLLLAQTLMASTPEQVFEQAGIRKLQEAIPNVPGASTGAIEIHGLYVASSDMDEGLPTYLLMDVTDLESGLEAKYSGGSGQVQAQILTLLRFGVWPIRCKITRTERKDHGGRFLFWLYPSD